MGVYRYIMKKIKKIALISTGGTIEKTYDPLSGVLNNEVSVLDLMLAKLSLRGVQLTRVALMNKDSLYMNQKDHELIAITAEVLLQSHDAVLVVHGTDTLAISGQTCYERIKDLSAPVVFTGAMRPYELRTTDALQNLTEALLACQILAPCVYVVMHNQALLFPGVYKDKEKLCFSKKSL
jgi:L-asparaginase